MMGTRIQFASLLLAWIISAAGLSGTVVSAASVEEIALMKSPNREKILLEGAKKEGKLSFYTGVIRALCQ